MSLALRSFAKHRREIHPENTRLRIVDKFLFYDRLLIVPDLALLEPRTMEGSNGGLVYLSLCRDRCRPLCSLRRNRLYV